MKNPYEVLGLKEGATEEEIRRAYMSKSKLFHPDRSPGDEEAQRNYLEVQESYEALTGNSSRPSRNPWGNFSWTDWNPFVSEPEVGRDIRMPKVVNTTLTVEEAIFGCTKKISYKKDLCSACRGNGAKDGVQATCSSCRGSGMRTQRQGNFTLQTPCAACAGRGKITTERCDVCQGTGTGPPTEVEVKIPSGIRKGQHLRVEDLIIVIDIAPHNFFSIGTSGLEVTVPITPAQAMAGSSVEVPSPSGNVSVKVPPEALLGAVLRVKGCGPNNSDMYVKFEVVVDIKTQEEARTKAYRDASLADEKHPPRRISDYQTETKHWVAEKIPEPRRQES